MRALVVVPTYLEADNVAVVLRRIRAEAPTVDVLVVDDNSPDDTAAVAERTGREVGGVEVMRRKAKAGLGSAYRDGFAWGLVQGYEVLVEMDADLSHDPADLPRLLAAAESGADLVVGSRYVPGGSIPRWSWARRMLSRQGNRYSTFMLRLPLTDATSGYRAIRAGVLARIDLDAVRADGYGFQIELARAIHKAGGTITEVPITFSDRTRGKSKMSGRIVLEAMALVSAWGIAERLRALGKKFGAEPSARRREHSPAAGREPVRTGCPGAEAGSAGSAEPGPGRTGD